MLENKVKLVIWDLDDTFWRGTLAEDESVAAIEANLGIVRALSERGIVNSICSKNDHERARARLVEMGIWEHFVFPSISFNPKGAAVAELIEAATLRAENVLFIDDNPSNLEEVKFYNPGIMTAAPEGILHELLGHPSCAGKPDPELTRLKQYQNLQRKFEERSVTALSNEDFLRASGIRVEIDYDVDANFDRVVELINRTNQLNYTKKRLETPEALEEFRTQLNTFGYYAGCVRAVDRYGDYGLIGFFLGIRRPRKKFLVHFVFSCRTMNMGIEQYVYESLGSPEIEIAEPVSYGLSTHERIDWINAEYAVEEGGGASTRNNRLVLLGGCDLLQLASYCSANRVEFVNGIKEGMKIRYDDPSFVLADRELIRTCQTLREFPWWTYEDALRFDEAIATADILLASLWPGMNGDYCKLPNGLHIRVDQSLRKSIRSKPEAWFEDNFQTLELGPAERLSMIVAALDSLAARSNTQGRIFVLGCYTRGIPEKRRPSGQMSQRLTRRSEYNETCRKYCEGRPVRFHYVDVDAIVAPEQLVDGIHFTRHGYHALAEHILGIMRDLHPGSSPSAGRDPLRAPETALALGA